MKKTYSYLMMLLAMTAAMTVFTSCEDDDDYIAQQLRDCDWQGYIDTYYSSRWSLSGNTYETVMRFESKGVYYTSGRGYEVDYDTRSPYNDYAYCTFKWFIVDGEITLIYDDDKWTPLYITRYTLYSNRFYGYISDGTNRTIKFDLTNSGNFGGWGGYADTTGGYGEFQNQSWFRSRTPSQTDVPFFDRSEEARQVSGERDAMSIASGSFAEKMME